MEIMNITAILQTPVEQVQERFRIAQYRWQFSFPDEAMRASAKATLVAVALFSSLILAAPYLHLLSVKVLISIVGALKGRLHIFQNRWQISFPEGIFQTSAKAALVAAALFFSLTLAAPYLHLLSVKVLISIAGALYAFEHFLPQLSPYPQLPPNSESNPTAASNGTNKSSENEVAAPLNQLNSLKPKE